MQYRRSLTARLVALPTGDQKLGTAWAERDTASAVAGWTQPCVVNDVAASVERLKLAELRQRKPRNMRSMFRRVSPLSRAALAFGAGLRIFHYLRHTVHRARRDS